MYYGSNVGFWFESSVPINALIAGVITYDASTRQITVPIQFGLLTNLVPSDYGVRYIVTITLNNLSVRDASISYPNGQSQSPAVITFSSAPISGTVYDITVHTRTDDTRVSTSNAYSEDWTAP